MKSKGRSLGGFAGFIWRKDTKLKKALWVVLKFAD